MLAAMPLSHLTDATERRVVEEEYIEVLALITVAGHGAKTHKALADRIQKCESDGDVQGVRVWTAVAASVLKGAGKPH